MKQLTYTKFQVELVLSNKLNTENKKKILIISPTPTHPPFAGNRSAILSYSELLTSLGHEVEFLFVDTTNKLDEKEQTAKYWGKKFHIFETNGWFYRKWFFRKLSFHKFIFNHFSQSYKLDNWFPPGLGKAVKKIQDDINYDIIVVNYIWLTKLFNDITNAKKILFTHDVFSNRLEKAKQTRYSVSSSEELKALNRCDIILAIQEEESKYFRSLTNKKVITTFSATSFFDTKLCDSRNILFLGGPNDYNTQGLVNFLENIWEEVRKEISQIKLIVGGRICQRPEIQKYSQIIELYGEVDNISDFFSNADIVINPVYEGTGLKIKNIEALSHQKIVICHPHNIGGMLDQNSAPLFPAENPQEYISKLNYFFSMQENILNEKNKIKTYMKRYIKTVESRFKEALI